MADSVGEDASVRRGPVEKSAGITALPLSWEANMMVDRRRKLGRFGIGGRLASAAATIAVLAVSPAIGSVADSHLDGVALAIAEAVFGEPASAQECTDRHGNPRQCTLMEKFALCLGSGSGRILSVHRCVCVVGGICMLCRTGGGFGGLRRRGRG